MDESTIIPMAMTSAPIVTILSENPAKLIKISVARRDIGIELPTIRLALKSPKKIKSTIIENTTPRTSVSATELKEDLMLSAASYATDICIAEFFAPTFPIRDLTWFDTSTVPSLCTFAMPMLILS